MGKSNYSGYQANLGPTFLAGPNGQAWNSALGSVKDYLVQRAQWAVKARFATLTPPDGLSALGLERGIIRGLSESQATYAGRVQRAWDSWRYAGTPFGLLSQLYATGYGSTIIISRGITYGVDAAGNQIIPTIRPKGVNPFWSTFTVIVPHPWPTAWLTANIAKMNQSPATGSVNLIASGTLATDAEYWIRIDVGGLKGTAFYSVSSDRGNTWGTSTQSPSALQHISFGNGTAYHLWGIGTFAAGDIFRFSVTPPNDSSADANVFRAVISAWKPANVKCQAITVLQTGKLIGYPDRNLGVATDSPLGDCSITSWTPPP